MCEYHESLWEGVPEGLEPPLTTTPSKLTVRSVDGEEVQRRQASFAGCRLEAVSDRGLA
jgi:hypothetical protein